MMITRSPSCALQLQPGRTALWKDPCVKQAEEKSRNSLDACFPYEEGH